MTIDTTRQFAGDVRLVELVRYVEASVPDNETEWLEWKSGLDFATIEACFAVAKGILGFSNRDPGVAARFAGGHAYFVLGAEPGSIAGQPSIDNDDVVKKVTPFVGSEVSWRPHWAEVDGKSVLVIEVDPPNWGDRSHPLQKQFQDPKSSRSFMAGQLFVRRPGGSHPVNPSELRMLEDRVILRPWRVTVRQIGGCPVRLRTSDREIADYVGNERLRLLAPLEAEEHRMGAATVPDSLLAKIGMEAVFQSAVASLASMQKQETRTAQQYRDAVALYADELEGALREVALARIAKDDRADLQLELLNLVDENLEGVRLELVIGDDVFVAGDLSRAAHALPSPPRIWGPQFPGLEPGLMPMTLSTNVLAALAQNPRPRVTRTGETTHVVFPPVNLRPSRPATVANLSIVGFGDDESLTVAWSATTTNKSGDCSGELPISLGDAVTLEEALNPPEK